MKTTKRCFVHESPTPIQGPPASSKTILSDINKAINQMNEDMDPVKPIRRKRTHVNDGQGKGSTREMASGRDDDPPPMNETKRLALAVAGKSVFDYNDLTSQICFTNDRVTYFYGGKEYSEPTSHAGEALLVCEKLIGTYPPLRCESIIVTKHPNGDASVYERQRVPVPGRDVRPVDFHELLFDDKEHT